MLTGIVLVTAEVNRIPEVAQELADIPGISEVYSVTGDIDLVVLVRTERHEELAEIISDRMGKVSGVLHLETHIAFQAFSRRDLDTGFSLGS